MSEAFSKVIARIYSTDRSRIVGSGFYLGDNLVVTCAHVVAQSIYGRIDGAPSGIPDDLIEIDFPLANDRGVHQGKVVCITPMREDGGGDIAVIKLNSQLAELNSIAFIRKKNLWGHEFRTFGFPHSQSNGLWVSGKILSLQSNDWLQIETESAGRIEPGYSGSAVWDGELSGIVGMVVRITRRDVPIAFVIPTESMVKNCPILEKFVLTQSNQLGDFIETSKLQIQEKLAYYRLRRNSTDLEDIAALAALLTVARSFEEAIVTLQKYLSLAPQQAYPYYLMAMNLLKGRSPRLLSRDEGINIRDQLLRALEIDKTQSHIILLLIHINQEYFDKKGFLSNPSYQASIKLLKDAIHSEQELSMLLQLVPDIEKYYKMFFV